MSAAAPVRRPVALRGAAALHLPDLAPIRTAPNPKPAALARPRLVLVAPHRTTAGRLPFLILVGAVLTGGLVAVLMLHMVAAQDAFRVTGLQQRLATLTDAEQQEAQAVAADSSPAALQARAVALGMEPTAITKFRRRPDGRAVGLQTPYYVPPPVTVSLRSKRPVQKAHAKSSKPTATTTSTHTPKTTDTAGTAPTTAKSGTASKATTKTPPKHHKPRHAKP
jgi:hypothetical protein